MTKTILKKYLELVANDQFTYMNYVKYVMNKLITNMCTVNLEAYLLVELQHNQCCQLGSFRMRAILFFNILTRKILLFERTHKNACFFRKRTNTMEVDFFSKNLMQPMQGYYELKRTF